MYQKTGMFMSAFELLDAVELSEEAIKCLAMAGRQTEAIKKGEEFIKKLESNSKTDSLTYANMLCMLGDIKRDITFYERAWKESNNRCARAMRSLARDLFFKNKF